MFIDFCKNASHCLCSLIREEEQQGQYGKSHLDLRYIKNNDCVSQTSIKFQFQFNLKCILILCTFQVILKVN